MCVVDAMSGSTELSLQQVEAPTKPPKTKKKRAVPPGETTSNSMDLDAIMAEGGEAGEEGAEFGAASSDEEVRTHHTCTHTYIYIVVSTVCNYRYAVA